MSGVILRELQVVGTAFCSGALITFVYDLLRIFRRIIPHGNFWIGVEDFVFWIWTSFWIFSVLYRENNGSLRLYTILTMVLGMIVYHRVIGEPIVKFAGKILKEGITLDVNSLYPSVLRSHDCPLPYGTPMFFQGKYKYNPIYPLYVQMFKCIFELKPGKIPTIQIKHSLDYQSNEYLRSSNGEEVTLCLNSIDMDIFFEHYNVYNPEYLSGWMFKASVGMFDEYIDDCMKGKIQATKDGNKGLRTIYKLRANSIYGKFGTDNKQVNKVPYFHDGQVKYYYSEPTAKQGVYIALASFVTSYARRVTQTAFQKLKDDYNAGKSEIQPVYADTDSLHCISPGFKIPEGLEIDPYKLGAWKFESKFSDKGQKDGYGAKFLRQKCYIENLTEDVDKEDPDYHLKITVAGMPEDCYSEVTFDNFEIGAEYNGKKTPVTVPGGTVLIDETFTIKP